MADKIYGFLRKEKAKKIYGHMYLNAYTYLWKYTDGRTLGRTKLSLEVDSRLKMLQKTRRRWEFINERFKEKKRLTRFRPRKQSKMQEKRRKKTRCRPRKEQDLRY